MRSLTNSAGDGAKQYPLRGDTLGSLLAPSHYEGARAEDVDVVAKVYPGYLSHLLTLLITASAAGRTNGRLIIGAYSSMFSVCVDFLCHND